MSGGYHLCSSRIFSVEVILQARPTSLGRDYLATTVGLHADELLHPVFMGCATKNTKVITITLCSIRRFTTLRTISLSVHPAVIHQRLLPCPVRTQLFGLLGCYMCGLKSCDLVRSQSATTSWNMCGLHHHPSNVTWLWIFFSRFRLLRPVLSCNRTQNILETQSPSRGLGRSVGH